MDTTHSAYAGDRSRAASRAHLLGLLTAAALACCINAAHGAAGETILVSVGLKSNNAGAASEIADHPVSANGRYVLISRENYHLILLRDVWRGTYDTIADGRGISSVSPHAVTPDGRYVSYGYLGQVMLRDRQAGITEKISVNASGAEANDSCPRSAITPDGRYVVFTSTATNLTASTARGLGIFVRDRLNGTTQRFGTSNPFVLQDSQFSTRISISDDARFVAFEATGPAPLTEPNVFVHDRQSHTTERISIAANGNPYASTSGGNSPSMTPDGRYVAFASEGSNFGTSDTYGSDVFVRDRQTGVTTRESYGRATWVRGLADHPSLSADGRFIAFTSRSYNLVTNDRNDQADVFVRDRQTGAIELVSVATDGTQGDGPYYTSGAYEAAITPDGRWVVFISGFSNLVPNDFNNVLDVFIHDRGPVVP
jgi:Tol biopolymer transport system component